jgi:tetratricopeptide (TPR) repeat protein
VNRQRVAELFELAIDVEPDALPQWLADTCGADDELRDELLSLLRADAKASRFMERPPTVISDAAAAAIASNAPAPAQRRFGPYGVLRSIGVGGMGEVWLAERSDGQFEQRVAIKQLAYPTPGLVQRFRQERQILARLEHANIARLIDGGVDDAGAPYLVMEYVEGVPITDFVREHALDLRARLRLFLDVCDGVQFAHQNLVVHRDLKPSNIFVTSDGTPKLLDFGIAKVLATTDQDLPTQTAARLLTPGYAAPEQFNGGAITTATDVYAMGVVLYELVADVRPARPAHSTDGSDTARAVQPPSAAVTRTTGSARRRELRGDLDRIVLKALANEAQRRYPSAEALAADLRRYLDGRPVTARGDGSWYRFRKFARRNRWALAGTVAAFAICLIAAIVSVRQAELARSQARLARDEAQRSEAVRQFLLGVFQQASPDQNMGQPFTALQLLEKGARQVDRNFSTQPALLADMNGLLGELYLELNDLPHAESLLALAVAASASVDIPRDVKARVLLAKTQIESEKGDCDAAIASAKSSLGQIDEHSSGAAAINAGANERIAFCLIRKGQHAPALELLKASLQRDTAALGENNDTVADEWLLTGVAQGEIGHYAESEASFVRSIDKFSTIYGENSTHVAHALNEMSNMLDDKGDFAASEKALRRALKIRLAIVGPDHRDTLAVQGNLLFVMESRGHFIEALPERLAFIERASHNTGFYPLDRVANYISLGRDYRELGQLDKAESVLREALAVGRPLPEGLIPSTLRNLGVTLMLEGRFAEAETSLRESLQVQAKSDPPTSPRLGMIHADIGNVLRLQHRLPEALVELRAGAAVFTQGANETNPLRPFVLAALAEGQLETGDIAGATLSGEQAVAQSRATLAKDHYQLASPLFALARARLAADKPAEAESLLREVLSVRSALCPAGDVRILEVKVALANALAAQSRNEDATRLAGEITPQLRASKSPYAKDLGERLATR